MMRRDGQRADSVTLGALALQRVLALEGRNSLARVELAASELGQLDVSPAARDRLGIIREAVDALDGVLEKIERLSDPKRDSSQAGGTPLVSVWPALVERLAPALRARGIVVETKGEWPGGELAFPSAVLDRLLVAFVRVVVGALEGADEDGADDATRLSVECVAAEDGRIEIVVEASGAGGLRTFALQRAERVELEVALAEWQGELIDRSDENPSRLGLRLRRVPLDG